MNKPSVSVVMPVYNSAKYLRECLNSLVNQTLKDIEIICVDDGSNDESLDILNEFRAYDDRILFFNQENRGAAEARNRGLGIANGKYIIFLDSDDVFELDMLEKMHCKAEETGVDITMCNYDLLSQNRTSDIACNVRRKNAKKGNVDITKLSLDELNCFINTSPWTKLVRKDFLVENNIAFQNLKSANDVYFSYMSVLLADSMCYIDDMSPMVHYRTNIGSQISATRSVFDIYNAFKRVYEEVVCRKIDKNKIRYVYVAVLHYLSAEMISTKKTDDEKQRFFDFFKKEGLLAFGSDFTKMDFGRYNEVLRFFLYGACDANRLSHFLIKTRLDFSEEKKQTLLNFCQNKKTVFWGLGEYGQCILPECDKAGLRFSYVCDGKQVGKSIFGYNVVSFSGVKENVDCVFVSTNKFFSDICETIQSMARTPVAVVNLAVFLTEDCNLEDCMVCIKPA